MRKTALSIIAVFAVGGCDLLLPIEKPATLTFTSDAGPTLSVRGKDYPLTRRTGRDKVTGEVFVVEYSTKVNGRRVTCVGDPNKCEQSITRELDEPMGDDY